MKSRFGPGAFLECVAGCRNARAVYRSRVKGGLGGADKPVVVSNTYHGHVRKCTLNFLDDVGDREDEQKPTEGASLLAAFL